VVEAVPGAKAEKIFEVSLNLFSAEASERETMKISLSV
jgi:hypothetical protein